MSKKRVINVPMVGRQYGKTDLERVGNAYSDKIVNAWKIIDFLGSSKR